MELWFSECHAPDVKHSLRVNRHLYSGQANTSRLISSTPLSSEGCWPWTET